MQDFDEKSETAVFKPLKEKETVDRTGEDEYSKKRKPASLYEEDEIFIKREEIETEKGKGNAVLITIASVLAVVLIAVIVMGVIFLKKVENLNDSPENEDVPPVTEVEEAKEEETEEEVPVSFECSVIFYGESVLKQADGYSILGDLYDESGKKTDNRKLYINSSTIIRESGKKMSTEAFLYVLKQLGENEVTFKAEIENETDAILNLSYRKEDIVVPEEEEVVEAEVIESEETTEEQTEEVPAQE